MAGTSEHDPCCPSTGMAMPFGYVPVMPCQCAFIAAIRADEREKYGIGSMEEILDEERERIAQAIEHFALVWQVYLNSGPTDIERQLAWGRVDALAGAARIARHGGSDE